MLLMEKKKSKAGPGRPRSTQKKKPIQALVPEHLCEELDEQAEALERPRSWVLVKALEEWLDKQRKAGDRGPRE